MTIATTIGTHPVIGYMFPSSDPYSVDPLHLAEAARQLAEAEADPLGDPEDWEMSYHFYLGLDDWEIISLYRQRFGY